MTLFKALITATLPFILSACASAISRQHNFEIVESKSIARDCKIQSLERRAIIPYKGGKLYILAQNSSRATWVGLPFIPFIPTFTHGDQLDSLRLDVVYRDAGGKASPDLPTHGWILNLDDKTIEGSVKIHQSETASGKEFSATVDFDFPPINAKDISVSIPSYNSEKSLTMKLQRHLETQYFGFAFGITHYTSNRCPEGPTQALFVMP